ncbi:hypothetical protein VK792_17755 [Mesobacterium sp. TK19101]|uniref:Uncharacterized protein n=1 Tax=Mesobacterium hydrothermale TaxID=3111907 RepID=A0ABU6HM16_9RHOB|nr:hypothetical protein [Mesobacterium sp. TK19101]MEC3863142.1 hypothetical protein [Mesobacterium sp. TK19101]
MSFESIRKPSVFNRLSLVLGFVLVTIGLLNTMPSIPGLDDWVSDTFGKDVVIRRFSFEYLAPLCFVFMMTIVALDQSMARQFRDRGRGLYLLGLAMDIALVGMAFAMATAYLIEIDSVCLIDQLTGERAELIARALQDEIEFAESMGLPPPSTVDDPACINTLVD